MDLSYAILIVCAAGFVIWLIGQHVKAYRQIKTAKRVLRENDLLIVLLEAGIHKVEGKPTSYIFNRAIEALRTIDLTLASRWYYDDAVLIQGRINRGVNELNETLAKLTKPNPEESI